MPKLSDSIETIEVDIPSVKGGKVEIKKDLRAGDIEDVYGEDDENDMTSALKALTKLIVSWNLEDDDEETLEVSIDNVRELTQNDVMTILRKTDFAQEEDFTNAGMQKSEDSSEEKKEASEE